MGTKAIKAALSEFLREAYTQRYTDAIRAGRGNYSQADMAKEIGLDPPVFHAYMNGTRLPGVENEMLLVAYFGNEISRILGRPVRQPEQIPDDPRLRFILENWGHLTERQRTALLHQIERDLGPKEANAHS